MKPKSLYPEVVALLIPRLKDEYTAFLHYRAAANYCSNVGYFKAAEFYNEEAKTELEHAKKIEDYLVSWNVTPELPDLSKPNVSFTGLVDTIEKSYKIEYDLYEEYEETSVKVFKEDVCTFDFLQFFRNIQRDSVAEYSDKLNMLEGVKDAKFELLLLEKKLF